MPTEDMLGEYNLNDLLSSFSSQLMDSNGHLGHAVQVGNFILVVSL